jgi:hypothetical protein
MATESRLLELGVNVAVHGVSLLSRLFKSREKIENEAAEKIRRRRKGISKKKDHVSMLIIPTGCGKTYLSRSLGDFDGDYNLIHILDIDNCVFNRLSERDQRRLTEAKLNGDTSYANVIQRMEAKNFFDIHKSQSVNSRTLIITSDYGLASFLGIEDVMILAPTHKLRNKILENTELTEAKKKQIMDDCHLIETRQRPDYYDTLEELYLAVAKAFNIRRKA